MADPKLARLLVWIIVPPAALGIALLGFALSDADEALGLGFSEVLLRGAAVATPLLALATGVHVLTRRLEPPVRRELVRLSARIIAVPAGVWTLFLLLAVAVSGPDSFGLDEAVDEWAVVAIPLALASAALFAVAREH